MLMSIISIIYNGIPINNVVQYLVMKIGKRNQGGEKEEMRVEAHSLCMTFHKELTQGV